MLKLGVIGAGSHSRTNHLPSLERYASLHEGKIELAALCDMRSEVATAAAKRFGFARTYTEVDEMLRVEGLDGCVAVTPVSATFGVAKEVMAAGVPLVIEKPPGATLAEAAQICAQAEQLNARIMVSMNRRFDPAITAALSWKGDRRLEYIRTTMLRHQRAEKGFFAGTAIHCMDATRAIAGDVRDHQVRWRVVDGVPWYFVELVFDSGASGLLEVVPTCGVSGESYGMHGPGYRIVARSGEVDSGGLACWEGGQIADVEEPARASSMYVKNGTYGETSEFIAALEEDRPPHPSPAEVFQSVELCNRIQEQVLSRATGHTLPSWERDQ